MTAYTTNKKLAVQAGASNSGVWGAGGAAGDDLNTGVMGPLDSIVAGIATFTLSSTNVSLTFTPGGTGNVSQSFFRFTGTLLANIVVSPAAGDATTYFNGFYFFENLTTGAFTVTVTTAAGSVVLPQARRGTMFVDPVNGPRIVSMVGSTSADVLPAGTSTTFIQASAPTGWTQVVTNNNVAMRLVNTAGAGTGGSVAFSTLFGRTATDGYTLQIADMPSHNHTGTFLGVTIVSSNSGGGTPTYINNGSSTTPLTINNTGGSGAHSHNIDMRVQYVDVINATRN